MTFIQAFTTNAMTLDFLFLISHGWVVTFPDSHRTVFTFRSWLDLLGVVLAFLTSIPKKYGIYISQLVRFARCCTSVFDFHSKNLQITSKLLTQGLNITNFEKHLESSLDHTSNFGDPSFQEFVSKGISHPVFYGDLVYIGGSKTRQISSLRVRK